MLPFGKRVVLLCGLGAGLAIGCKGGGGGGNLGDAYVNKLQSCGLLSEGELPMLDDSELDETTNCFVSCLLRASCEELEAITCEPFNVEPSEQLIACYQDCEVEGEGQSPFTCGDGEQIPGDWKCDGEADCEDGSDELGCVELECADGSGSYPQSWRCDGYDDCEDGSDELDCPGFVECADGNGSTPEAYLCDGYDDCEDGSDELGCPTYACANGEQVVGGARCDLFPDCEDGSDEQGCAQLVCPGP
ncbi:MAG: LDL receptor domain-containing protein [Enhygromyxa sp.]